jgi:hypothetical protein
MVRAAELTEKIKAVTNPLTPYQVTYRISEKHTATGTSHDRYNQLVGRLEKMQGVERGAFEGKAHTSTSAWIVMFAGTAQQLFDKLKSAVTARCDMLEIIEVNPKNHHRGPPPDKA